MKKSHSIKIVKVLIFSLLIHNTISASPDILIEELGSSYNIIDLDTYNTSNILNEVTETETESLSEEELLEIYVTSIEDAKNNNEYPDRCNFPTLLSQPEFHPNIDDFFGKESDTNVICAVDVKDDEERNNYISLTFDSAFVNKYTYQILDKLDEYGFKATFFMTHDFMKNNPDQIIEIVKRGHEVGNHSTTHPHMNEKADHEIVAELWKAHSYYKYLTGLNMCLFRFPYGEYQPRTISIAKMLGYYPIQWQIDSRDWTNESTSSIINRLKANNAYKAGNIILFHNGAKYTPECLDEILQNVVDNDLKAVRVTDLIYEHDFYLRNGRMYKNQSVTKE